MSIIYISGKRLHDFAGHHAQAYGVHINGFVRGSDGQLQLWVARRSSTKPTWPSLLDHIAAGGQVCGRAS